jgi:hypothetical protein
VALKFDELFALVDKKLSSKMAIFWPLLKVLNENSKKPIEVRLRYCKEVFLALPVVIYAKQNFYLLDVINEKLEAFKSAGLIDYWIYNSFDFRTESFEAQQFPTALTMNHLLGSFSLLLAGCLVSFVVFLVELKVSKTRALPSEPHASI